jgi:hypothetical protein
MNMAQRSRAKDRDP